MSIDEEILKIDSLRFAIKIEINSSYGVNFNVTHLKRLYDRLDVLLKQRNRLQIIKDRIEKLNKIKNLL
jgi:hypothetical protein